MKPKTESIISSITLLFGVLFMVYMIIFEDEPGGIPLILIVTSIAWKMSLKIKKSNRLYEI